MKKQPKEYFEHHLHQVKEVMTKEGYGLEAQDKTLLSLARAITNKVVEEHPEIDSEHLRKYLAKAAYAALNPLLSKPLKEVLNDGK